MYSAKSRDEMMVDTVKACKASQAVQWMLKMSSNVQVIRMLGTSEAR